MINSEEIATAALKFGVPDTQIARDHLISHVLATIGDWPDAHELTFFGGTALCRIVNSHTRPNTERVRCNEVDGLVRPTRSTRPL